MLRTSTVRSVFSSEVATLEASSNVIVHPSWKIAGTTNNTSSRTGPLTLLAIAESEKKYTTLLSTLRQCKSRVKFCKRVRSRYHHTRFITFYIAPECTDAL